MELNTWITLTLAIFTLILMPGPTGMNQVRLACFNPLRKCVVSAFGATTVSNLYIAAVFAFMTTIQQYTTIIQTMQFLGVGYLIYVAWKALKSSGLLPVTDSANMNREASYASMYLNGATVAASNPKDLIFFISFLPLFVQTYSYSEYAAVAITWTFFDVGFSVLYAAVASFIVQKGPQYSRCLNAFAGSCLMIIAFTILYRLFTSM